MRVMENRYSVPSARTANPLSRMIPSKGMENEPREQPQSVLIQKLENDSAHLKKIMTLSSTCSAKNIQITGGPRELFGTYFAEAEASLEKKMSLLTDNIAAYCADGRTVRYDSWKKNGRKRFRAIPTLTKDTEPWSPIEKPKGRKTNNAQDQTMASTVKPTNVPLNTRYRPMSSPSGGGVVVFRKAHPFL